MMKIKKNQMFILAGVFVLLLVLIGNQTGWKFTGAIGGGSTPITLSQVSFLNSPQSGWNKVFLASVLVNSNIGNSLYYGVSTDNIPIVSSDGKTTSQNNVKLDFKLNDMSCRYTTTQLDTTFSKEQIYQFSVPNAYTTNLNQWNAYCQADSANFGIAGLFTSKITEAFPSASFNNQNVPYNCNMMKNSCRSDYIRNCPTGYIAVTCTPQQSSTISNILVKLGATSNVNAGLACVKVVKDNSYVIQRFGINPVTFTTSAKIIITKEGSPPEELNLDSQTSATGSHMSPSGKTPDFYASIDYGVVSLQNTQCPSGNGIEVFKIGGETGKRTTIVDITQLTPPIDTTVLSSMSLNDVYQLTTAHNTAFNNYDLYTSTTPFSSATIVQSTSGVGSININRTTNPPILPILNLIINADWVGYYSPQGSVKLTCPTTPISLNSGQQVTVPFTVTNNGSTESNVNVNLPSCVPSISIPGWSNNPSGLLAIGEQKTGSFYVGGQEANATCTLTATSGTASDKCIFMVGIGSMCTGSCDYPFVRNGTTFDPCNCICPITVAYCNARGMTRDSASCSCIPNPNLCGNGACDVGENITCPGDCPCTGSSCQICGDDKCTGTETENTCYSDCHVSKCGDGYCEADEKNTCVADCGVCNPLPICPSYQTVGTDCLCHTVCPPPKVLVNGVCEYRGDCMAKVDLTPCNKLDMGITKIDDPFCGFQKAVDKLNCVVQGASIICIAGIIIALIFGVTYLMKNGKGKRR